MNGSRTAPRECASLLMDFNCRQGDIESLLFNFDGKSQVTTVPYISVKDRGRYEMETESPFMSISIMLITFNTSVSFCKVFQYVPSLAKSLICLN